MSFNTGVSGLNAASADLDVISNNIANANTWGFKQARAEFGDIYASTVYGSGQGAIGLGVQLESVTQDFSQGDNETTGYDFDFAITGPGFFTLSNQGQMLYSRAGAFHADSNNYLVNTFGSNLVGYLPDYSTNPEGTISSLVGNLQVSSAQLPPVATTQSTISVNLDSNTIPPIAAFVTGFTPTNPPATNTYNFSQVQQIYDSLGNVHDMTLYFAKEPVQNQWQVFVGIDGTDMTPGASSSSPRPFTAVFNDDGQYIINNPGNPPVITQTANVTGLPSELLTNGGLIPITAGQLVINGVSIGASTADGISTAQPNASAAALQAAITAAAIPGVSATVVPANVNLGVYTPPSPAAPFPPGCLVINGTDLTGTYATATDLANAISTITGLTGVASGNNLSVLATDGRNIEFQFNGTGPNNATFSNLNLETTGDLVQRGSVKLVAFGSGDINITGTAPLNAGFTTGTTFATAQYSNSDNLVISNYNPGEGAGLQTIAINLTGSTQYAENSAQRGLNQNGSSVGQLVSIDTNNTGVISATYSNGSQRLLGQVLLSNFNNPQGLQPQGNSMWSATYASGNPQQSVPGTLGFGILNAGQLEQSNVNITEELVDLIIAQRNFQANAQTIKTEDAITQTIINIQ